MAKKKELELDTLLTKLSYVFPSDLVIIDGCDVVEGPKSLDRNDGHYSCSLNEEARNAIKNAFGKKQYIYIKDVKKAKKEPDLYISFKPSESDCALYEKTRYQYLKECANLPYWDKVVMNEDAIETLFLGDEVNLYFSGGYRANVSVSKSLLPLVAKTNFDDLIYSIRKVEFKNGETIYSSPDPKIELLPEKEEPFMTPYEYDEDDDDMDIVDVVFLLNYDYFDVYMCFSYILW